MTLHDPCNTKTMETGGSYVNIFTAAAAASAAVWCFKACVTINKSLLRTSKKTNVQFVVAGHETLTRLH